MRKSREESQKDVKAQEREDKISARINKFLSGQSLLITARKKAIRELKKEGEI